MNATPDQFSPFTTPTPGMEYMPPPNLYDLRIGFGRRFGAFMIDLVITVSFGVLLYMIAGTALSSMFHATVEASLSAEAANENMVGFMETFVVFGIGMTLISFVYSFVELLTGASPGKHVLGIIAAHADRKQGNISLYATRWAVKNSSTLISVLALVTSINALSTISSIVGFIIFIGFFFMFGEKRQALHDIIAKTAIYQKEDVLTADDM